MSSRSTYHATVSGFKTDIKTNDDLICLSNVIDSDGDIVATNLDLVNGNWSKNLEEGTHFSFSAKIKSRLERQKIDDQWFAVRAAYLYKIKLIE